MLKTAEYDQMRILSEDDSNYQIGLLPYAIIFDLNPEWAAICGPVEAQKVNETVRTMASDRYR